MSELPRKTNAAKDRRKQRFSRTEKGQWEIRFSSERGFLSHCPSQNPHRANGLHAPHPSSCVDLFLKGTVTAGACQMPHDMWLNRTRKCTLSLNQERGSQTRPESSTAVRTLRGGVPDPRPIVMWPSGREGGAKDFVLGTASPNRLALS